MSHNNNNETKTPTRGKTNGYSSAHLHAKRNRKRQDAEARQREHDTLTLGDKIKKATARRGQSKRELRRLVKLAEATGVVVTPPVAAEKKATKSVAKKAAKK